MSVLSPSQIVVKALRLQDRLKPYEHVCATDEIAALGCSVCGGSMRVGEMVSFLDLKSTFTNISSLARAGESV